MRMTWRPRTLTAVAATVVATAALVGGGVAVAAGTGSSNDDLSALADRIRTRDAFETAVAKELGTTAEALDAAIVSAASARIDAAEKAGTLSAADADVLREAVADGERMAMHVAAAADVAAKLGTTEAKLDAAYAKVRKQEALARVAQALKDERITQKVADELEARIEQATFPGFGAGGFGHHGGRGHGGPGVGPMGHGHGDRDGGLGAYGHGGLDGAPSTDTDPSSSEPAVFM